MSDKNLFTGLAGLAIVWAGAAALSGVPEGVVAGGGLLLTTFAGGMTALLHTQS